jgi:hypothetical protein
MDVGLVLLRSLMPELPLMPGSVHAARIVSREAIVLGGVRLAANLPEGLEPGARIAVRVQEATPERLVLQLVERPSGEAASGANAAPVLIQAGPLIGLPGGAHAQLFVDPDEAGDEASAEVRGRTITLRYESAGLGRVDLALTVDAAAVRAVVHGPAGEVAERLRAGSGDLRAALMGALGRPVSIDVIARTEAVDVDA